MAENVNNLKQVQPDFVTAKAQEALDFFFTKACQYKYIEKQDFLDAQCGKQLINKALSVAIIAGSFLLKVPQMMKIVSNKSAEGISMLALFLEVINYSVSVVHNLRHNNPLIAWAETLNLTFQNIVLMVLVMVYGKGNMLPGTVMFVAYAGMLFVMQDEQAFTSEYLSIAFAGGTMLTVAARGIQIAAIQSAGHAQNLSFATVALQFGGSVARVFTTIHEMPDDTDMLFAFGAASLLNGVILLQLIYFWNAKAPEVAAKDAEKKTQ